MWVVITGLQVDWITGCNSVYGMLQNLVYENGVLLSGPLDSFIQHLVPTASYFPDVCNIILRFRAFIICPNKHLT